MTDRTLPTLGFADIPAKHPLTYPGRPITRPTLLTAGELWELTPTPGGRLGTWTVDTSVGEGPMESPREPLDALLTTLGHPSTPHRHPIIAVGSNASPAQLHHKLSRPGHPATVPMVPVDVHGIAVGCSAHIGRYGYVASAPYTAPGARTPLVISWLDAEQLAAVDATEYPNYRRVLLPGTEYPMVMPSGERLGGAYLYVGERGVLMSPDGTERPLPGGGDQSALLTRLLAGSPRLRELLGPDPGAWVARAGADPVVRKSGTRIFQEEGWTLPQPDLLRCPEDDHDGHDGPADPGDLGDLGDLGGPRNPRGPKSYGALTSPE
ncbi:hypothetical protein [Streptomyces violaceusniger]|uniref:Uncharacterized protein n=1 Tax=Streptomyces violaceusniger (strain Tu 4113) TaxID=653045 RepID=G2NT17_STRV4|nr:hypothetical protein [Streptomyces violaceusniger]AEM81437.1 hypothetical protein Strvi_1699 [Streptomyces violaceusniger Tu 4113]